MALPDQVLVEVQGVLHVVIGGAWKAGRHGRAETDWAAQTGGGLERERIQCERLARTCRAPGAHACQHGEHDRQLADRNAQGLGGLAIGTGARLASGAGTAATVGGRNHAENDKWTGIKRSRVPRWREKAMCGFSQALTVILTIVVLT